MRTACTRKHARYLDRVDLISTPDLMRHTPLFSFNFREAKAERVLICCCSEVYLGGHSKHT